MWHPLSRIRIRGRRGRRQSARIGRSPPQAHTVYKLYNEPAASARFFVEAMLVGRGFGRGWVAGRSLAGSQRDR
eukprot:9470267-Pyramimonas_sp.AAC.1